MRGGALPPALLCAALGFALSFAPRRALGPALVLLVALAVGLGFSPLPASWREAAFIGCWASVVLASASVHLRKGLSTPLALILAANTGLWAGAVIAEAGAPLDLAKALPWALLCLPGGWLVSTSRQIVIKVVASWLIAVSLLVGTLPLMAPTPGYAPDHME